VCDASTVFWADASVPNKAMDAESIFAALIDEKAEATKVAAVLERLRQGLPMRELRPDLQQGVRFHVLALAPNAARLSVRFYVEDEFGTIAERWLAHLERIRVEPGPREPNPSLWRQLIETATLRKSENIQPNLAGDWLRAILVGAPYPLTLLASVVTRIRADGDVNAIRVGILKSVLIRNFRMEAPVSLDTENRDQGYLLGRLFAAYERAQEAALGRDVNATIKDKFYGAASAQPRKVFPLLDRGSANHLSKLGKKSPGQKVNLERLIGGIMEAMAPDADPFPASLPDRSQALFALGYYHQRASFFVKSETADRPLAEDKTP
jgi:CRISPR-associated protein Csd1